MTLFENKKLFFIIILLITVINLTFLITVSFNLRRINNTTGTAHNEYPFKNNRGRFMKTEIGFNKEQQAQFQESRIQFREKVEPLHMQLRHLNKEIIIEVTSISPDIAKSQQINRQIGDLHTEIKNYTFQHLMEVREIASPDQMEKLSKFYNDMLPGIDEEGRGKQYRHRMRQRLNNPNEN